MRKKNIKNEKPQGEIALPNEIDKNPQIWLDIFSQGCGEELLSYTVAENINANWYNSLRWGIWKYLESIHMYLPFDTASLPIRFSSKSILSKYKMTDEWVYYVLFLIIKIRNSLKLHS